MSVRQALLALLAQGPQHGYQLRVDFERVTGGLWPLNGGQVYTTIDRLIRDGLVTEVAAGGRAAGDGASQRRYELTDAGHDEVADWWEQVPEAEPPPRDELAVKVLVALGSGDRDLALAVVTAQRSGLTARLQRQRREERASRPRRPVDAGALAAADLVVARAEADLRWLDLCEERLRAVPEQARDEEQPRRRRAAPRPVKETR